MKRILGCFIFLMITSQIFAGTVYYVDATKGNDANPGTELLPWRTIQKAANTMIAGDTVTVYDGTYAERVTETTSGSEGNLITYQVNSGDTVSCQGFEITGDYIKIDGFTVTATFCTWYAAGIWVEGDNCIIENNYAYNCPKSGIVTRPSSSDCIIRNNRCYLNSNSGITIQGTNHLVETNEVWGSVVYHAGTGCTGDADGFRFFGSGHIFR